VSLATPPWFVAAEKIECGTWPSEPRTTRRPNANPAAGPDSFALKGAAGAGVPRADKSVTRCDKHSVRMKRTYKIARERETPRPA
jgi:hypothetical protein